MTLLFCLSPLGKEHKMLLLFTLGKEQFNEKLGKGRKFTFSWINFQMTQPIWRVHILYISASLKKKKNSHVFLIKAKITSISIYPIFLTYYNASGERIPQTNAVWAATDGEELVISIKNPLFQAVNILIGVGGKLMWIPYGSC